MNKLFSKISTDLELYTYDFLEPETFDIVKNVMKPLHSVEDLRKLENLEKKMKIRRSIETISSRNCVLGHLCKKDNNLVKLCEQYTDRKFDRGLDKKMNVSNMTIYFLKLFFENFSEIRGDLRYSDVFISLYDLFFTWYIESNNRERNCNPIFAREDLRRLYYSEEYKKTLTTEMKEHYEYIFRVFENLTTSGAALPKYMLYENRPEEPEMNYIIQETYADFDMDEFVSNFEN